MGKKAQQRRAAREAERSTTSALHGIPRWSQDSAGQVVATRPPAFWHSAPGGAVDCTLCYRRCRIEPGAAGWCDYRANQGGRLVLPEHGVLARCQRQMLGLRGGIRTFLPGARALALGLTRCTAGCSFCSSAAIVHNPETLGWLGDRRRGIGTSGGWHYVKSMLHPQGIIQLAQEWRARAVVFAENEPLLSWEYTYDVARLARKAGLKVVIYTNGFSSVRAIEQLAPFVDAVDLGIKGSLDPDFYAVHMRSPGAVEHVKAAALAWRAAGVSLILSDLIPAAHLQDDDRQQAAQTALYAWAAETLGEHTPILIGPMVRPELIRGAVEMTDDRSVFLKGRDQSDESYAGRIAAAWGRARQAGLAYAHVLGYDTPLPCHSCGAPLLQIDAPAACGAPDMHGACSMFTHYCDCWRVHCGAHKSRCIACGAAVPIVEA